LIEFDVNTRLPATFVGNAPGTSDPNNGAGSIEKENAFHFSAAPELLRDTSSEELSHVRPIAPDFAKRRFPIPIAWLQYDLVSCKASEATAPAKMATIGQKRYICVMSCMLAAKPSESSNTGTSNARVADKAPIPTHNGHIAFARSAFAKRLDGLKQEGETTTLAVSNLFHLLPWLMAQKGGDL
jgi:hypothetical protein